jgi:RNA polymerase sigma-70 factor, ECF subfamily
MASPSDDNPLEETLRLAAAGDADAWRAIIDLYSGRVYGLIRAQCGNSDLAEEITQSTFCTIVAKLPAYTESGKFEPWLFRIAMNRLRDEMRRRKRHAISVDDEALRGMRAAGSTSAPGGLAAASRGESAGSADPFAADQIDPGDIDTLRHAMTQLPDADQRIIHLRHNAELSFKQIADVLGQPVGTVLARHHRALKKLKDLFTEARKSDNDPD